MAKVGVGVGVGVGSTSSVDKKTKPVRPDTERNLQSQKLNLIIIRR
jgi:hypothetical protein